MESIYETTNGSTMALVNEEEEFYILQLIGKVSKTHYKAALEAILEDAEMREFGSLLLNTKDMTDTPDPWQWWFTNHFLRKLDKAIEPRIYIAVVHPLKFVEKYTIPYFYAFLRWIGWKVKVNFFENIEKATKWLQKEVEKNQHKSKNQKNDFNSEYGYYSAYRDDSFDFNDNQEYEEDEDNYFEDKKSNKNEKKSIIKKVKENIKIKKTDNKTTIEIGKKKSNFKFKFHFDKKGGFEKKPMVERYLPKFEIPSWLKIGKKDKDDF